MLNIMTPWENFKNKMECCDIFISVTCWMLHV